MKATTTILALSALLAINGTNQAQAAEVIKPQIGEPLRDAAVTRAPDGAFYLTGSRATGKYNGQPDFMENDGVRVWRSTDLRSWQDLGRVWTWGTPEKTSHEYLTARYAFPDRPMGTVAVIGALAPRLQFTTDSRPLLTLSMGGHDAIMIEWQGKNFEANQRLNWKTLKPFDRCSWGPGYASIFRDVDGSAFKVLGPGYIAKLSADLQKVDASAKSLLVAVKGYPNAAWCAEQFDPRGGFVFLSQGKYFFVWAAYTDGVGYKRDDTFVAVADRLFGPYSEPQLLLAGGGPATLFETGEAGLMLSCSIADQPVLAPVKFDGRTLLAAAQPELTAPTPAKRASGRPEMYDYAKSVATGTDKNTNAKTGRSFPAPLFDMPLRAISVIREKNGTYYLTGTTASKRRGDPATPDFENNDGIYLWQSRDRLTWVPLGKVWDIEKNGSEWDRQLRIPGDNPARSEFCRGVTGPELVYADGTFWIAYSMNGRGSGLLKSASNKAEGPYVRVGRLTGDGGSPSMFVDEDGTGFWLWGDLMASPLNAERTALAGEPLSLYLALAKNTHPALDNPGHWDSRAAHIFAATDPKSKERRYYLTFSGITQRTLRANNETLVARAKHPLGPYEDPIMFMPHGGQTSVVADDKGNLFATFYGADPAAVFRDRPSFVPLAFGWLDMPRKVVGDYFTLRGPWTELESPLPQLIYTRDTHVFKAPDGYWYYSSSGQGRDPWVGGIRYWRTRDFQTFEDIGFLYTTKEMVANPNWPVQPPNYNHWNKERFGWEPSLNFINGRFWLTMWFGGHEGKISRSGIWKGGAKIKDPFVFHSAMRDDFHGLFQDTNGAFYGYATSMYYVRLTDDLSAIDPEWVNPQGGKGKWGAFLCADGAGLSEDIGFHIIRVGDYYLLNGLSTHGSYDMRAFYARSFEGPYKLCGTIPYAGNCNIFQAPDGRFMIASQNQHGYANYSQIIPGDPPLFWEVTVDLSSGVPEVYMPLDKPHRTKRIYE